MESKINWKFKQRNHFHLHLKPFSEFSFVHETFQLHLKALQFLPFHFLFPMHQLQLKKHSCSKKYSSFVDCKKLQIGNKITYIILLACDLKPGIPFNISNGVVRNAANFNWLWGYRSKNKYNICSPESTDFALGISHVLLIIAIWFSSNAFISGVWIISSQVITSEWQFVITFPIFLTSTCFNNIPIKTKLEFPRQLLIGKKDQIQIHDVLNSSMYLNYELKAINNRQLTWLCHELFHN